MCAEKNRETASVLPAVSVLPTNRSPEAIKSWIREVCDALSLSPTKLAERAEVAHTTISRFLSGKSINKNISPSTIGAISTVVIEAVDRGEVVSKKDPYSHVLLKSDEAARAMIAEARAKLTLSGLVLKTAEIKGHIGHGIVQSGREEIMWHDAQVSILVDPALMLSGLFGMEMREEDNEYFKRGDILFCTDDFAAFDLLNVNSFVVICGKDRNGNFENVLFVCKQDPAAAYWLVPTWNGWEPSDQVYLGKNIDGGLRKFNRVTLAVACSLRAELPPASL